MLLKEKGEAPFDTCRVASCSENGVHYITMFHQNRTVWMCQEHYEMVAEENQALWRKRKWS